jgi:hypothetical protein
MPDTEAAPPLPPDPLKHPEPTPAVDAVVTPVEQPAPLIEVLMYNLLGPNWKTTAQGILNFFGVNGLGLALAIKGFDFGAGHPKLQNVSAVIALLVTFLSTIGKWYIGTKQMDAGPK